MNTLGQALSEYLELRRGLGFKMHDAGLLPHIPHIEFVNRPEFPPHGGGRRQVLAT